MSTHAEGEALELTGVVTLLGEPRTCPFTGEPCAAHISVARVFTQLDFAGELIERIEVREIAPFMIETPDGPVFVVDTPAIMDLEIAALTWVPDDRAMPFLAKRNLTRYVRSSFFEHALIAPGETVRVSGVVTREPDPTLETSFRDVQVRTRLTGYDAHPLTLRRAG